MTKYIIVNNDVNQIDHMIIFPASIDHNLMAKLMKQMNLNEVVSAGFIDEFVQCYGSSSTLRLTSRYEDTDILHKMLQINDKEIKFKKVDVLYKD